jgi:hypothetical protein
MDPSQNKKSQPQDEEQEATSLLPEDQLPLHERVAILRGQIGNRNERKPQPPLTEQPPELES